MQSHDGAAKCSSFKTSISAQSPFTAARWNAVHPSFSIALAWPASGLQCTIRLPLKPWRSPSWLQPSTCKISTCIHVSRPYYTPHKVSQIWCLLPDRTSLGSRRHLATGCFAFQKRFNSVLLVLLELENETKTGSLDRFGCVFFFFFCFFFRGTSYSAALKNGNQKENHNFGGSKYYKTHPKLECGFCLGLHGQQRLHNLEIPLGHRNQQVLSVQGTREKSESNATSRPIPFLV